MRLITKFGDISIQKGHSYYWVVNGKVPLAVAQKLYDHSIGRAAVRVSGHCICPSPQEWAEWFDEDGKKLIAHTEFAEYFNSNGARKNPASFIWQAYDDPKYRHVDDPSKEGHGFVTLYHIDTTEGLLFFVVTLMNELKAQVVF